MGLLVATGILSLCTESMPVEDDTIAIHSEDDALLTLSGKIRDHLSSDALAAEQEPSLLH